MNNPNLKNLILWTLRRNENDIVNLYDYLSSLMQLSTEGNFLNFGYWGSNTTGPLDAQICLCKWVAKLGELSQGKQIVDVGSGFSEPSLIWINDYPHLEITCLNVNSNQLRFAALMLGRKDNDTSVNSINLINSTAVKMPLADESCDRVIALESAQHFRPFTKFISEANRILKKDGLVVLAIPILSRRSRTDILKIGILRFTWSSEHYNLETIKVAIKSAGLEMSEIRLIGSNVYIPLADYYIQNRKVLRSKILSKYPSYVEKILFQSILKMKEASKNGIIEYALIKCIKA